MVYFNASNLPYPFEDKSFDLVSCISSLIYYKVDWNLVLDEFFRIARETVLIVVNHGEIWDNKRHFIDNYILPDGWELNYQIRSTFKWVFLGAE
jgi:ubiquinone/menaquinone biosynthesis C-methylase UbiE